MSWNRVQDVDVPDILGFLLPREWTCVAFTTRIKAAEDSVIYADRDGNSICQAVMFAQHGVVLPVLDPRRESHGFDPLRAQHPVHSVMGLLEYVRTAQERLGTHPVVAIDYHLMTLTKHAFEAIDTSETPNILVRTATPADSGPLLGLQRGYELEEVLLDPRTFSKKACLARLNQSLSRQIVYLAELHRKPVAKAGTNARGYQVDQLGGVYTEGRHRNRGLARAVVAAVLRHVFRTKPMASLYVKKDNIPALRLYTGLGFEIRRDFRVSYFGL